MVFLIDGLTRMISVLDKFPVMVLKHVSGDFVGNNKEG